MHGLEEKGKNAMELARRELDFARTAQEAPSVKETLLRSQTFVPMAPPQPWGKRLAQAGAGVLALALIFAPWIPNSAVISSVQVAFDQVQTESAAQQQAYGFLSYLPPELLMGAEFKPAQAEDAEAVGQLALRISGLERVGRLEQAAQATLDEMDTEPGPVTISPGITFQSTSWQSPVQLIAGRADSRETKLNREIDPGLPLAQEIITNDHLLHQGLADHMGANGFAVSGFGLLDGMSGVLPARFDFMIADSWPRNFGITIDGYHELTDAEQQQAKQHATEFFMELNLHQPGVLFSSGLPGSQLLRVQVVDSSNRINDYLTNRLQAAVDQPEQREVSRFNYDPADAIEAAMLTAIPKAEYELDTTPMLDETRQICGFWITVTFTGQRSDGITDRSIKELQNNVDLEL